MRIDGGLKMKNTKLLKSILLMVLIISVGTVFYGCSTSTEVESKEQVIVADDNVEINESDSVEVVENDNYYPVTYTTYNYAKEAVEVVIEKAPEKVVAVYQNSIETLLALGLEDKIVAAAGLDHKVKPEYQSAFEKIDYLEKWQPAKETIVMLEPDFILSWYSYFSEKRIGDVDYYHNNSVGTYMALNSGAVSPRTIKNECKDILTLGKIFNVNERAIKIVDDINNKVSQVAELAKGQEQKSVLLIEFSGDKIRSYGQTSLAGDMVTELGAELLNKEGNPLGAEDLIELDADTIFVIYYNGGERTDEEAENGALSAVLDNDALANLKAVKNNKVFAMPLGEMYSSGIRTIDGIKRLASGIYE